MTDRLPQCSIISFQVDDDQNRADCNQAEIQMQLLILCHIAELPQQQEIIAAEVYTEQHHKDRAHILDIGAVARYTVILDTESTGTGSTKCRAGGI